MDGLFAQIKRTPGICGTPDRRGDRNRRTSRRYGTSIEETVSEKFPASRTVDSLVFRRNRFGPAHNANGVVGFPPIVNALANHAYFFTRMFVHYLLRQSRHHGMASRSQLVRVEVKHHSCFPAFRRNEHQRISMIRFPVLSPYV